MLPALASQPTIVRDMEMIPISLEAMPIVEKYLRRFPPRVSELTFTNLFVWRKSRPVWLIETEDSLSFVVEATSPEHGKLVFGPPLGPWPGAEALRKIIPDLRGFVRIPQETADALEREALVVQSDDGNSDYLYRVSDLAELKGEKYHKKRNLIQQCLSENKCSYAEITPKRVPDCLAALDQWCFDRKNDLDRQLADEYRAIREMFANYGKLGLIGGAILVNGCAQAWSVGEELGPGTAVCHFEKAAHNVHGLTQLLNQWFAKNSLGEFEFVNREQDLGIPGLRQAKQSYHPCGMVRKFKAFFPDSMKE